MPEGMILKGIGGLYSVRDPHGIHQCRASGLLRKDGMTPLPGDRVAFDVTDAREKEGYITSILPRTNTFIRPAVSNIQQAVIVLSVKNPPPDYLLADKLLCLFQMNDVRSILCINKSDLASEQEISLIMKQYEKAGCPILVTDILTEKGVDPLFEVLKGNTTVLAGQSGVGKSSLLNKVIGYRHMETGSLSERVQKGKHTTRHAEFIEAFGGYVVDTPGFSTLDVGLLDVDRIKNCYNEFEGYQESCRFNGCMHMEEPGCAVKQAVEQKDIPGERYERYLWIHDSALQSTRKKRGY
ncbi:MAG: ribosome small subunit-dependent GTPase A [Clostridia bacterium]